MRIIIDILTPKQCLFFEKLIEQLEKRGHKVFRTTRRYHELNQLMRMKGFDAKIVGKHGGMNLSDKLRSSAQRIIELTPLFTKIDPDLALSFSSPEMARVSYGLNTPHFSINDSPHAEAVSRLTIPLSDMLFTPKMIPKRSWTKYGISRDKIIQYNSLDPWIWLRDFMPDPDILNQLGLDNSKPILTFRPEESFASYLLGKIKENLTIIPIIREVLRKKQEIQIVALPRYPEQKKIIQEEFKDRIVIPKKVVDGPSILYYSSVFVGGGGTMTAEAVMLGVPTISCYPGKPYYILKYLIKKRLVHLVVDPNKLQSKILEILSNIDSIRKNQEIRARELTLNFEDPINIIIQVVEKSI